ncbi:MAG: FKBP-type peptidyl-prolyl cis-trans isomerase [Clostridiales Family XIII bacterium]|jgi:FKBP-type peptidyl-prolyl cis-trans isomerase|nr:FKBP-type peptidyl-prolyl cis-trans isomerase [Clostridiales Family XIII bacterium]
MMRIKKNIPILTAVLMSIILILSFSSCSIDGKSDTSIPDSVTKFNDKTNPQYLQYEDLVIGKGRSAKVGDKVSMNYTGYLFDGTKFDSSKDRNTPFEFTIGNSEVIKGWDEGIQGMKVGGIRILIIPSDMAYGSAGAGDTIPPDSPLRFKVKLLKISKEKKSKK